MSLRTPTLPFRTAVSDPDRSGDPNIFPRLNGQAFPQKGPRWNTTRHQSASGRKFKRDNWSYPIWQIKVTHNSLSSERDDWSVLLGFYNSHRSSFFYWDRTDNKVTNQIIGTGDGVTTLFQLTRSIGTWIEPVLALVGPPTVQVNHVAVTNFEVLPLGIVRFDAAPAAGAQISASFSFMFVCEFMQDSLTPQQLNMILWSNDGLLLETVKP